MPIDMHAEQARRGNARGRPPARSLPRGRIAALLTACMLAAAALHAGRAHAGEPGQVQVIYADPEQFTEFRRQGVFGRADDRDWLDRLARHVAARAARPLAAGEQLKIVITDVDRAGDVEPWRGPPASDVRIVRDIYPPAIDLRYTLTDAEGVVRRDGVAQLRDPAFLMRPSRYVDDPLRYEKTLVDDWVDHAFGSRPAS